MQVGKALKQLQNDEPIIVAGKTFEPSSIETLKLDTNEMVYWVRDGADLWLSLDPASEEYILFNEIEAELDPTDDLVVFNGEDYEFTYEGEGDLYEEDENIDKILFRDYEGPDGRVLRIAEYTVNSELISSIGQKVPEEEVQRD